MSEIKVLSSIATREAYNELLPQFERQSGQKVTTTWAGTVEIMKRMAAGGEQHDLVVISATELEELVKRGKLIAGSRVDLAKSGIGAVVRAGAPKPDIGSIDALRHTLLAARTVGYTSGPSGVHVGQLIERMGIAADIKPKFRSVPSGGTIGSIVASGDCEIGFQQVSELVHIVGTTYVGPLPPEAQRITVFSSGVQTGAANPAGARALQAFLTTQEGAATMRKHGLETA